MSPGSPTDTEAQVPTPEVEAERSSSPSQEKAMSTDSTTQGSTGAPNVSAQRSSSPEDTGSQANDGSTPSSSNPAPVNAGASPPAPTSSGGDGKKAGQKRGEPFNAEPTLTKASDAKARIGSNPSDAVAADAKRVDHFVTGFDAASFAVAGALGKKKTAQAVFEQAERAIAPAVGSVFWPIRMQPGGPSFLNGRRGATDVETAESVLTALVKSPYTVPAPLLDALRTVLAPASEALATLKKRKADAAAAKKAFKLAKRNLLGAIKALNRSLEREKYASSLPAVELGDAAPRGAKKKGE